MGTNVYCAFCEEEVGHDDSFVVETTAIVQAFHYICSDLISEARERARGLSVETNKDQSVESVDSWKQRELSERLDAVEDMTRKVTSVWRLWLNDAERGSINPGTFDAMKNLLGME